MVRRRIASAALVFGLAVGGVLPVMEGMAPAAEAAGAPSIGPGARGSQVLLIQRTVGARNTGFYGNETKAAVTRFQRWFHMRPTGVVDRATAMKILQVAKIKAKPAPRPKAKPAPPRRVTAPSASLGIRAIQVAATQRGKPYVWGATGPQAFDCSGLTQYVYNRLGKRLPRTTYQQYAVTKIPANQLRPGDLIFTRDLSHVGIYAGYGSMWNAPRAGAPVRLQAVWYSGYLVGRVR
jgi:cell wall-associated NlpC family hydrolase